MRVISGKYRGKKLISPKDNDIRPTTDKAKESLFNMIQGYVYASCFLDLFSGSGAISIEAISRGADFVTSVEKSKKSLYTLTSNINSIDEKEKISVKNNDVIDFLNQTDEKYDIIFADPPYNYKYIDEIVQIISSRKLLRKDGIFVFETEKEVSINLPLDMRVEKEKIYSISKFTVIKWN